MPYTKRAYADSLMTIEHEFDHTVINLLSGRQEDEEFRVVIHEDCVEIQQFTTYSANDQILGEWETTIYISFAQLQLLSKALDLPEGTYLGEER